MIKYLRALFLVSTFCCCCTYGHAISEVSPKLPLAFRENAGQVSDQYGKVRDDIDFQMEVGGASVFIGAGMMHYQWNSTLPGDQQKKSAKTARPKRINSYRMDVMLLDINPDAELLKEEMNTDVDIYYAFGLEGKQAKSYRRITYRNIYPNIDWVLYTQEHVLKYDFVIRAGGKASDIKMRYGGATSLELKEGQLIAGTPMGTLTEAKPYSYDPEDGREIVSHYQLDKDVLRFDVGGNEGKTFVIDPELRLGWSTYYGGTGVESAQYNVESEYGYSAYGVSVVTGAQGDVYLYGTTNSVGNIATTGAYQTTLSDGNNVYVAKFNAAGQRIWSTYFGGYGGSQDDEGNYAGTVSGRGHAIACDASGNVYITGNTGNTSGIATAGAHQPDLNGGNGWPDLFLAKFDDNGNRLWATYLGNPGKEEGGSVAVTADGSRILLAGATKAYDPGNDVIAAPGAFIPTGSVNGPASYSGFLNCFNAAGQRQWGSYISDVSITSTVYDLVLDQQGALFITGYGKGYAPPGAPSLTTTGSHQPNFTSCNPNPGGYGLFWETPDAFLQKWDINGNRIWGTYYGDGGIEVGYALAADDNGNVYMSGITSASYPNNCNWFGPWRIATAGSYMDTKPEETSSFLVKFSGAGQRQWGTFYYGYYFFGNSTGLAVYKNHVFSLFHTSRANLATPCAFQTANPGIYSTETVQTTQLAIFDTAGVRNYATYFGGKQGAWAGSLAISETADEVAVYMGGITSSNSGIATPGSFKPAISPGNKSQDAFLVKFILPDPREIVVPCFTADSTMLIAADTTGSNYYWNNGKVGKSIWVSTSGTYVVNYLKAGGCPATDTLLVAIYPMPVPAITKACKNEGMVQLSVKDNNKNLYQYRTYSESGELINTTQSDQGLTLTALSDGNYSVQILAGDCDTTFHFTIASYPDPVVSVSGDTVIVAGRSVQLQAEGALYYRWHPEQWLDNSTAAAPVSRPQQDITYTVTGYNVYGCRTVADVRIMLREHVLIPNAFSPNGDGINDEFRIADYGFHKLAAFRVFNRYGEEVFYTTDPDQGWNGYYKNKPADLGTYYFYIKLNSAAAGEKTFKGDLTLIR